MSEKQSVYLATLAQHLKGGTGRFSAESFAIEAATAPATRLPSFHDEACKAWLSKAAADTTKAKAA